MSSPVLNPERLVLLDRDGVINIDSDEYIKSADEWKPIPGSLEAIACLNKKGIDVIVITNQSGIGRGLFKQATLDEMHKKMQFLLEQHGGHIKDIFFCPHRPDENCSCRKPRTGLLDQLEKKYNISLEKVPYVGDTSKDLELAAAKNCQPILVKTGKGKEFFSTGFQDHDLKPVSLVFENLQEAGDYLLKNNFNLSN